jgi:hypothetical protein
VPFLVRIGNSERENISSSGAGALSAIDESTTDTMVLWTFSHRTPPEQGSSASLRQRRTSSPHRRRQEALDAAVADIGNAAFAIRGDVSNLTHHDQVIAEESSVNPS